MRCECFVTEFGTDTMVTHTKGRRCCTFYNFLKHVDPLSHMFGATPKNATEERE